MNLEKEEKQKTSLSSQREALPKPPYFRFFMRQAVNIV